VSRRETKEESEKNLNGEKETEKTKRIGRVEEKNESAWYGRTTVAYGGFFGEDVASWETDSRNRKILGPSETPGKNASEREKG